MKIRLELLARDAVEEILAEAASLLETVGVEVEAEEVTALLHDHGARVDTPEGRVRFGGDLIERALRAAPRTLVLYDRDKRATADLGSGEIHFAPGSAALSIFDPDLGRARRAVRADLDRLAVLIERLPAYALQSTAIVPSDVPHEVADLVRLGHALSGSRKPVVTGTFHEDGLAPMVRMLEAVRGSGEELAAFPLAIFDCCPTPPLKWPRLTSRALVECARRGIPVEIVPVPLCGATAPVTLHGALVQIAAENLSGIAIAECARPGAPVIWGGCPMAFDMRHGTTATGAPETMLLNAASAEIARHLGLPAHGYVALSDAKLPDMQAGFETAMGALVAALSPLGVAAGAGMMSFIGCQSLEKIVFDAAICETALRVRRGIDLDANANWNALFSEALAGAGFLGLKHTRRNWRTELALPAEVIDRAAVSDAPTDAFARCRDRVARLLADPPPLLSAEVEKEIAAITAFEIAQAERR